MENNFFTYCRKKMEGTENLQDIKEALKELKNNDRLCMEIKDLSLELGQQKEKANYMEKALENAKTEIHNRDCLIEKVIKENEYLENKIKAGADVSPKIKQLCTENDKLRRELENCQRLVKTLEEKYKWTLQCVKEKENFIETMEKNYSLLMEKVCNELSQIKMEKEKLETERKEGKECVEMLRGELTTLNRKYENVCMSLQDRLTEMKNLTVEYEKYKRNVELIKDYVIQRKMEPQCPNLTKDNTRSLNRKEARSKSRTNQNEGYEGTTAVENLLNNVGKTGVRRSQNCRKSDTSAPLYPSQNTSFIVPTLGKCQTRAKYSSMPKISNVYARYGYSGGARDQSGCRKFANTSERRRRTIGRTTLSPRRNQYWSSPADTYACCHVTLSPSNVIYRREQPFKPNGNLEGSAACQRMMNTSTVSQEEIVTKVENLLTETTDEPVVKESSTKSDSKRQMSKDKRKFKFF